MGALFTLYIRKVVLHGIGILKFFSYANSLGLDCFSTPFDLEAVDFLESINCPFYKIASFENCYQDLILKVCQTGKPVIVSLGLSSLQDILDLNDLLSRNASSYVLLKCTSSYPSDCSDVNLLSIPHLSSLLNCPIGLSDHSPGIGAAVASIALGVRVIEKHVTLDKNDGGVDSSFP